MKNSPKAQSNQVYLGKLALIAGMLLTTGFPESAFTALSRSTPNDEEVWRINCGLDTSNTIDPAGNLWMRDESYASFNRWGHTNGFAASSTNEIPGTTLQTIYQTHRWGGTDVTYKVELPNGLYQVKLMFAETFWTQSGQRIFDVAIEGVTVLTNHDVYAEVGGNASDDHTYTVTVNDNVLDITFPVVTVDNAMISGIEVRVIDVPEDSFLDFIQKKMFWYFWTQTDPDTGLIADSAWSWTSGFSVVSSVASTGFGLSALTVGASRGWITPQEARDRIMKTLDTFENRMFNLRGFWYHLVNITTADRDGDSEISTVDSSILIMGALQAGEYFRSTYPEIAQKADLLYRRMEWDWWLNRTRPLIDDPSKNQFISMAWKPEPTYPIPNPGPEGGYFQSTWWDLYSEAVFVDLLALGAPTYSISPSAWTNMHRNWIDKFGYHFIHEPALFTHQYHHLYYDLKDLHDTIANYHDNSIYATLENRETCIQDPQGRYGPKRWGLTAGLGPDPNGIVSEGTYNVYGTPPNGTHDGTVVLTAPITSITLTPFESMEAARHMFFQYKHHIWGKHGFTDSLNVEEDFVSDRVFGLNNGPMVIAIENFRTGMVQNTFTSNPNVQNALDAAGFRGYETGPLVLASSVEDGRADLMPQLAMDNDMTTRWSSVHSDPQWLAVDFGSPKLVNKILIEWEAAYGKSYKIQTSQDGKTWTDVFSTSSGDGGQDLITFAPISARFVRMYGTERGTPFGYSIYEISFTRELPSQSATASSEEVLGPVTFFASNAIDGDMGTRWSSDFSDPQWISVNLGEPRTINKAVLDWEVAFGKSYKIQVSNDSVNWITVFHTTTGDGGRDTIYFPSVTARYVRMFGTERGTPYGYSLWEFGAEFDPFPPPSADVTPPVTEMLVSGPSSTVAGDLFVSPLSLIGLSAIDPLVEGSASGVALTEFSVDGEAFRTYSSTFTVPEGIHMIRFYSLDLAWNRESIQEINVLADATPPVTSISISSPGFSAFGRDFISPKSPIALTAGDPHSQGPASGVKKIEFRVDDLAFQEYTSPFSIAELLAPSADPLRLDVLSGTHTIEFRSTDKVENRETVQSKEVFVTILADHSLIGVDGIRLLGRSQVEGDIRSGGKVSLVGRTRVIGSVVADKVKQTGHSQITGETITGVPDLNPVPIDLDPITDGVLENNNNDQIPATSKGRNPVDSHSKFRLSGRDRITLTTGTYVFTRMTLSGRSKVNIAGNVNILCLGSVRILGRSSIVPVGEGSSLVIFLNHPSTTTLAALHLSEEEIQDEGDDTGEDDDGFDPEGSPSWQRHQHKFKTKIKSKVIVSGRSQIQGLVYAPFSKIRVLGRGKAIGNFFAERATMSGRSALSNDPEGVLAASGLFGAPGFDEEESAPAEVGPDPTFRRGEIYSFPNPAKRGKNPTLHVESGIADSVEIRIYDIAGDLVHEVQIFDAPAVVDNRYAYEYTWDTSGTASGVYIYAVSAKKSGEPDIRETKKLAVIK